MMVPSRSMKTARDFALVEVIYETRYQFVARDSCRSQFTNHHGAGVIGDLRGFEGGRVAHQSEREHRDCGVAGTGHIENISRLRRNVVRSFALFEKHHTMFAERDEEILRAPFLEQVFPGMNKIDIFLWRCSGIA